MKTSLLVDTIVNKSYDICLTNENNKNNLEQYAF